MTKTLKFSAIALLAVVVLWACGGKGGPKEVAEKFLNAIAAGDYDGASKYATKEAQESLKMMATMGGGEKGEAAKIEIGDVKEEGDKATVSYKENGTDKTLDMVKEDGEWKANWSKGGGALENAVEGAVDSAIEGATEALDSAAGAANEAAEGTDGPAGH
jgi:Domain of unknown function (DUF4878)